MIGQAGEIPSFMLHRLEILAAEADQHGAVEFRIAADIVVIAGIEGAPAGVVPDLLRPEDPLLEDGAGVAACRAVGQPLAALQDR